MIRLVRRARLLLSRASLRTRVMAAAAVLVALASAVMGFMGTQLLKGYLVDRVDSQLRGFSQLISNQNGFPDFLPPGGRPPQTSQLPSDFLIELTDNGGRVTRVVRSTLNGSVPPPALSPQEVMTATQPFTAPATGDAGHSWRVKVQQFPDGTRVVIAFGLDGVNDTVGRLALIDAGAAAVAIALLAVVGLLLVRASLAPLTTIEETAEAIAAGDLSRRIVQPPGRTEVARLAAALNIMLGRIETAYRDREEGEAHARDSEDRMRRFVGDASHELRTPLTSIRGFAEFYAQQGSAADRAEITRLMTRIQQEATRMGLLVDDLLLLAQLDQHRPLDLRPVDLASVAAEAVHAASTVQPGRRLSLVAGPDPVIVRADGTRLRQVIDNLLSNALQHTPPGTPVTIVVDARAAEGRITVTDAGPGMTPEHAARVFERFYRTDAGRSRATGGTGLGLSIATAIITAHGGTITLDTRPGEGASFCVQLPRLDVQVSTSDVDAASLARGLAHPASR